MDGESREAVANTRLPEDMTLNDAMRRAAWLGASGVAPNARGRAARLNTETSADMVKKVRPERASEFVGRRWEVSGSRH